MLRSGAIGSAIGILVLASVGSGTLPAPAVAKPIFASSLIVTPAAGKALPARPVAIRARAGRGTRLGAKLNGQPIPNRLFRPTSRGVRGLRASASHGLRHGRNVLLVRARHEGARRARVQRVRFRVRSDRPLAAAGLDRRVAQHAHLSLAGRKSRPRPARRGRPLRYRWSLLRAPRGSKLWRRASTARKRDARGRAAVGVRNLGPRPRLRRMRRSVPHLRFDHPGIYRLRLTVTDPDGRRGADTVTLRADPTPLVSLDTMAKPAGAKFWGVRVGTQFHPDPGKNEQWLQVVTLKTPTLEFVSNNSYNCPAATTHPHQKELQALKACTSAVRSDIEKLEEQNRVVIAVSQRVDGKVARTKPWQTQPPVGFWTALGANGGSSADWLHANLDTPLLRGRISAVLRTGAGGGRNLKSVVAHDPYDLDETVTGQLDGFLLRSNLGTYSSFAPSGRIPYETSAKGSTALTNVTRVGSARYAGMDGAHGHSIANGEGGIQATLVNPETLRGATNSFRTRVSCAANEGCATEITEASGWIEAQVKQGNTLLFLATVGDPRIHPTTNISNKVKVDLGAAQLAGLLSDKFGASANRVYWTLNESTHPHQPHSYTLVANYGASPGTGLEREGALTDGSGNGVPLSGSMGWEGSRYALEPGLVTGKLGDAGVKLREVALSQPGSWPEQGHKGRSAAIAWVGGQTGIDSHRSLYWTQPYTTGFWDAKKEEIEELAYPGREGFGKADFGWAKAELAREIRWLKSVHGFTASLARPFAEGQLDAWSDVEAIASEIEELVEHPSGPTRTALELGLALRTGVELAEAIPVAGNIVRGIDAMYHLAAGLAEIDEGGREVAAPFRVKVGEVGKAVAGRLTTAQETLEDQLADVVVADYRKLRTVGLCAALSATCPDKPLEQWQLTQVGQQRQVAMAIRDGMRALVYTALLPAKYDAWLLPVGVHRETSRAKGNQAAGQTSSGFWCGFHGLPLSAQVAYPLSRNVADVPGGLDQWQVVAFASRTGRGGISNPWKMDLPKARVTDPLVAPRSRGGLGLEPEVFFRRAWQGQTRPFDHYPEATSGTLWVTKDSPAGFKNECGW